TGNSAYWSAEQDELKAFIGDSSASTTSRMPRNIVAAPLFAASEIALRYLFRKSLPSPPTPVRLGQPVAQFVIPFNWRSWSTRQTSPNPSQATTYGKSIVWTLCGRIQLIEVQTPAREPN